MEKDRQIDRAGAVTVRAVTEASLLPLANCLAALEQSAAKCRADRTLPSAVAACMVSRTAWAAYLEQYVSNPYLCTRGQAETFSRTMQTCIESVRNVAAVVPEVKAVQRSRLAKFERNEQVRHGWHRFLHADGLDGVERQMRQRELELDLTVSESEFDTRPIRRTFRVKRQSASIAAISLLRKAFEHLYYQTLNLRIELLQEAGPYVPSAGNHYKNAGRFIVEHLQRTQDVIDTFYLSSAGPQTAYFFGQFGGLLTYFQQYVMRPLDHAHRAKSERIARSKYPTAIAAARTVGLESLSLKRELEQLLRAF